MEEEEEDVDQYELTITVAEPEKVGKWRPHINNVHVNNVHVYQLLKVTFCYLTLYLTYKNSHSLSNSFCIMHCCTHAHVD